MYNDLFYQHRYHLKKDASDLYLQSKKTYSEQRGLQWTPQNKRPFKLREKLKELEVSSFTLTYWLCFSYYLILGPSLSKQNSLFNMGRQQIKTSFI